MANITTTTEWLKDPQAVLDWTWDWTTWLQPNEQLTSSAFAATPGITIDSISNSTNKATVWLSGGTPGIPYQVTNTITTNQGRTDERSITIRVKDR